MDARTKGEALEMLGRKARDPSITYGDIALATGYSERQLRRWFSVYL